mgnify:CR=1 FL=1
MTWTAEKLDRLRKMWSAGDPASAIGVEIGFSRSAVLGKVHRLKLAKRRITDRVLQRKPPTKTAGQTLAAAPKPAKVVVSSPVVVIRAPEGANRAWPVKIHDVEIFGDIVTVGRPMIGAPQAACRWPIDGVFPRLCCHAQAQTGRSYCAAHSRLAYVDRRGHAERPDELSGKRSAW